MTKVCVIGLGSIGKRHARLLKDKGVDVYAVSSKKHDSINHYLSLSSFLNDHPECKHVIVSNITSAHLSTLNELKKLNFKGRVLVEKPLFSKYQENEFLFNIYVAYNFRFHPLINKIKDCLQGRQVYSVIVDCGQYLPYWRPEQDYKSSYSASVELGGGVLRDLSHEIDYINYLFGPWQRLVSLTGKKSNLEIKSEDVANVLVELKNNLTSVFFKIDYLSELPKRTISIVADGLRIDVDLIAGTFKENSENLQLEIERDYLYKMQIDDFLSSEPSQLCSYEEGLNTLKLIELIEDSSRDRKWVGVE